MVCNHLYDVEEDSGEDCIVKTGLQKTETGIIPKTWKVVEIGDVFKLTSGKTKPRDTKVLPTTTRNIPVYGGNGILGYTSQYLLEESTLILGRVGEYCGCAHLTVPYSWVTDNALLVKEEKISIDRCFARDQCEYLNLNKYSNKMGQPLITQGIINRVKFVLPPLPEQKKSPTSSRPSNAPSKHRNASSRPPPN